MSQTSPKQLLIQKKQLMEELADLEKIIGEDGERIVLEAIIKQDWYSFKNKELVVFDKKNGLLFPNFNNAPHIPFSNWENIKNEYAPHGIGLGEWDINKDSSNVFWYPIEKYRGSQNVSLVHSCYQRSRQKSRTNLFYSTVTTYYQEDYIIYMTANNFSETGVLENGEVESISNEKTLPQLKILDNPKLHPDYPNITKLEKAKIILDFFLNEIWDWVPLFDEEYIDNIEIFDAYFNVIYLKEELLDIEQALEDLKASGVSDFYLDFDYRQELEKYNLTEINNSVLQYSVSAQQWLNHLLAQIDHYENSHQHLLAHAAEINKTLTNKLPSSLKLEEKEQQILTTRHGFLQQHLNFSLESLKLALIEFLQQNKQTEITLKNSSSLTALAELEKQTRPSFTLLAEYSANLYNQAIKKLDWLEKSLDFVQTIIKSEQQSNLDYVVLLDKYQQDLIQIGLDHSIETEKVEKWFVEWREKRLQILQQWQPLVEAGLTGVITEQTVLDTLQCLAQYQRQIDMFYLSERLGIYTTYAFAPNGHRQEEMAKELEFMNISHAFMKNLEKVIFAAENTIEQKVWLVRFGEVWQQGTTQEIIKFLKNEGVFNRSDIAQIISEGEREIQQQNLTACLQDMKSFAQGLGQREKMTNTLIYKMRKALEK